MKENQAMKDLSKFFFVVTVAYNGVLCMCKANLGSFQSFVKHTGPALKWKKLCAPTACLKDEKNIKSFSFFSTASEAASWGILPFLFCPSENFETFVSIYHSRLVPRMQHTVFVMLLVAITLNLMVFWKNLCTI